MLNNNRKKKFAFVYQYQKKIKNFLILFYGKIVLKDSVDWD